MSGKTTAKPVPLIVVKSTPASQTDGVVVKVPYAALAKYEVNIRSFHPNEQFEGWGFRFHGDNRGFSLGESYFGKKQAGKPTSRIWQRYMLDMDIRKTGDISKDLTAKLEQESNPSKPGPGWWKVLGHDQDYNDPELQPLGTLTANYVNVPHGGQKEVGMQAWYGGENHAFIASTALKKTTGKTPVPTLDVFSEVFIRVERISLYMDIVTLVHGDGFPNCEGFIQDAQGNKLFLGTHVRIGLPATHLAGENHRLMWANAIRVEIDENGNFGERLWVFSHVLGGPPAKRDEYPVSSLTEFCKVGAETQNLDLDPIGIFPKAATDVFRWDCGDINNMTKKVSTTAKPLMLSAFTSIDDVRNKLQQTWKIGPSDKTTRTQWNQYHLHRDPNEGRSKDYYDVKKEKWKT